MEGEAVRAERHPVGSGLSHRVGQNQMEWENTQLVSSAEDYSLLPHLGPESSVLALVKGPMI
jgi:hypothetical protein